MPEVVNKQNGNTEIEKLFSGVPKPAPLPTSVPALSTTQPSRGRRYPDYVKILDFGSFKLSMAVWVNQDSATLVVSTNESGKWTIKLKEELKPWRSYR